MKKQFYKYSIIYFFEPPCILTLSAKQMFIQVELIFHKMMNNFMNMRERERERERERSGETQGEERVRWVKRGLRSACQ